MEPSDTDPTSSMPPDTLAMLDRAIELRAEYAALERYNSLDTVPLRDPTHDLVDLAEQGLASNVCPQLIQQLNAFNRSLDADLEVGVCIIGVAGRGITLQPTAIEPWDPSLVIIYGKSTENSQPVQIIQHISQLSIALVTLPREDPAQPKHSIGFRFPNPASE